MFVGVDSHFTQSSPGAGLDQKAATLHAQGVTALSADWSSDIDTASTDTVNLSSDLSGVTGGTTSTKLTASLAKILQSATSVDPATGTREINANVGQALGTQLGQWLAQSGFSQADAVAASQSLLNQLGSTSQSSSPIAVSITGSAKTAGNYTGALSGGQENSTWSAQSTTALSISFDASSGNLSVKLDQHQISATSITWGSATLGSVSIALTQSELQPLSYAPAGTTTNSIGSPIRESLTTTYGADPASSGIAASNVEAPTQGLSSKGGAELASLDDLLAWQRSLLPAASADIASLPSYGNVGGAGAPPRTESAAKENAQQAVTVLQGVLKQLRDATTRSSVSLKATTNVGTLISSGDGTKSLTYTRPSGGLGLFNLPSVKVNA